MAEGFYVCAVVAQPKSKPELRTQRRRVRPRKKKKKTRTRRWKKKVLKGAVSSDPWPGVCWDVREACHVSRGYRCRWCETSAERRETKEHEPVGRHWRVA